MFAFSFLIYAAALMSFAFLYSYEASKTTVETLIVPYDNTGNDGYTCLLISRVNAGYQLASTGEPALAYNLVNVMESKLQCEDSIAAVSPCAKPLMYYPGAVVTLPNAGMSFGAAALFGDALAFFFDTSANPTVIVNYGYTTGIMLSDINELTAEEPQTNTMAVNRYGYPIYVAKDGMPTAKIYKAPPDEEYYDNVISFDTGEPTALVFNDNMYNIYYAAGISFCALDVYVIPRSTCCVVQPDGRRLFSARCSVSR